MINFLTQSGISAIFLTVILIIYLIIVELGNPKVRKALFPFIVIMTLSFIVIAIKSIYSVYTSLK